jgi:SAM-dependent methyltransferase
MNMKVLPDNKVVDNLPWFKRWFDSAYYHMLYANRDENEARCFIDALIDRLQPIENSTMLDVGCGAAVIRNTWLHRASKVTGFDLAFSSTREAKKSEISSLHFFCHDMRAPFGKNRFDFVFNFFTSFGYFKSDRDNHGGIQNMSGALKPCSTLVLDYLNVQYAEDHLVAEEEKLIDGVIYHIQRWFDDKYFYKKIEIEDRQSGQPFQFIEQVARFTTDDFNRMFAHNNLHIEELYGDYVLNDYDPKKSPRLIIAAKKAFNAKTIVNREELENLIAPTTHSANTNSFLLILLHMQPRHKLQMHPHKIDVPAVVLFA